MYSKCTDCRIKKNTDYDEFHQTVIPLSQSKAKINFLEYYHNFNLPHIYKTSSRTPVISIIQNTSSGEMLFEDVSSIKRVVCTFEVGVHLPTVFLTMIMVFAM